jgi:hypothetical protein
VELLRRQGIVVQRFRSGWQGAGEAFTIDSVIASRNASEGHRTVSVEGRWQSADLAAASGWYFVPTGQRLGVLAAYLLEPESEDGFVTWNLLDRDLRPRATYPVRRVRTAPAVPLDVVP